MLPNQHHVPKGLDQLNHPMSEESGVKSFFNILYPPEGLVLLVLSGEQAVECLMTLIPTLKREAEVGGSLWVRG